MVVLFWLVLAPLVAGVAVLVRRHPAARRGSLARFARRVGLPVPQRLRSRLERTLAARNLAGDLGAIAGVVMVAVWAAITRSPVIDGSLWPLVLIGAAFTGAAVGAGLTAARQAARRPADDEPRLARPTAATLADYVAPLELQGGRAVALLPAATVLVATAIAATSEAVVLPGVLTSGLVTAALLPLAVLAATEVAGRRLLQQPQTAGSDLELAWSDALRARVLRDLVTATLMVGGYATFGVMLGIGEAIRDQALRTAGSGALALLLLAAVGIAVASTIARPQRYFRRRLWPTLQGATDSGYR